MSFDAQRSPDRAAALALLVADLDAGERGFVLGRLSTMRGMRGESDGADCPLAGAAGRRCAEAMERIEALPRPDRFRLMNGLAREALAPIPAGTEHVHPDTLRALLEAESTATIRLLVAPVGPNTPPALLAAAATILAERGVEPDQPDAASADGSAAAAGGNAAVDEIRRAVLAPLIPVPVRPPGAGTPARMGLAWTALDGPQLLGQLTRTGMKVSGARPADGAGGGPSLESLRRMGASALGAMLATDDPSQVEAIAQRLPADLAQRLRAGASGAGEAQRSRQSGLVDAR